MKDLCVLERENIGRGEWTVRCTVVSNARLEQNLDLDLCFDSELDQAVSALGEREVFDPIWERIETLFAEKGLKRYQKVACAVEYTTEYDGRETSVIPTALTEIDTRRLYGFLDT